MAKVSAPTAEDMREVAQGKGTARDRAEVVAYRKTGKSKKGHTSRMRKVKRPT